MPGALCGVSHGGQRARHEVRGWLGEGFTDSQSTSRRRVGGICASLFRKTVTFSLDPNCLVP